MKQLIQKSLSILLVIAISPSISLFSVNNNEQTDEWVRLDSSDQDKPAKSQSNKAAPTNPGAHYNDISDWVNQDWVVLPDEDDHQAKDAQINYPKRKQKKSVKFNIPDQTESKASSQIQKQIPKKQPRKSLSPKEIENKRMQSDKTMQLFAQDYGQHSVVDNQENDLQQQPSKPKQADSIWPQDKNQHAQHHHQLMQFYKNLSRDPLYQNLPRESRWFENLAAT